MLWKDVIELGQEVETVENFEVVKTWVYKQVFVNKKSVRQSEVYQAATVGLKPELMFEVRSLDYDNEERVKYNNKLYEITRVYDKGEITELICTAKTGSDV